MKTALVLFLALFQASTVFAAGVECVFSQSYHEGRERVTVEFHRRRIENIETYNSWWFEIPQAGMLSQSYRVFARVFKSTCGKDKLPCTYVDFSAMDICVFGEPGCSQNEAGITYGEQRMSAQSATLDPRYLYVNASGVGIGDFISMVCTPVESAPQP